MEVSQLRGRILDSVTILAGLAAIAVVVMAFGGRNRQQEDREDQARAIASSLVGFMPGPISVRFSDAEIRSVEFGLDTATIVGVYRNSCPACQLNKEPWKALAERLGAKDRIVFLAGPGDADTSLANWPTAMGVEATNRAEFVAAYPVPAVPATLVIRDRKIVFIRVGVLRAMDVDSILLSAGLR